MANDNEKLKTLAEGIAKLMPEWTLQLPEGEESSWNFQPVLQRGAMEIVLSISQGRLNVSTSAWPSYTKFDRGRTSSEKVYPSSLYPRESSPSISVSAGKTPDQIVKDIKRRFLPEYERIFALCQAKAIAYQEYEDKSRALWVDVMKVANTDREGYITVKTVAGDIEVENRHGSVQLKMSADSAELLERLIQALGGLKKALDTK
jgi:hypothetical protein